MQLYKPREDSFLLQKQVKKFAKGFVLDVGTGSGILALEAVKKRTVKKVIAMDIQQKVIDHCQQHIINKKIQFLKSNLFNEIEEKFDTIIFNPPYLPQNAKLKDLTLDGGKKGYEVLERFLNEVNDYLKPDGIVLIGFSSLTKKEKIDGIIERNLLSHELLDKKHVFFEDLFVYLIQKTDVLKKLEKKISNLNFFAKGHRGFLFKGKYKGKDVAVKLKNPKSEAIGRIQNEIKYLRLLNKHKIGPKLIFSGKDYFVYEYIKGDFILDFIEKNSKSKIKKVLKDVFNQMFIIDNLGINKEEMHHPYKHIIINKNKPILIDFERCYKTKKPHNVTQFCQFLISKKINFLLNKKKINIDKEKVIEFAKRYKKNKLLDLKWL